MNENKSKEDMEIRTTDGEGIQTIDLTIIDATHEIDPVAVTEIGEVFGSAKVRDENRGNYSVTTIDVEDHEGYRFVRGLARGKSRRGKLEDMDEVTILCDEYQFIEDSYQVHSFKTTEFVNVEVDRKQTNYWPFEMRLVPDE